MREFENDGKVNDNLVKTTNQLHDMINYIYECFLYVFDRSTCGCRSLVTNTGVLCRYFKFIYQSQFKGLFLREVFPILILLTLDNSMTRRFANGMM